VKEVHATNALRRVEREVSRVDLRFEPLLTLVCSGNQIGRYLVAELIHMHAQKVCVCVYGGGGGGGGGGVDMGPLEVGWLVGKAGACV
jgi:hypothetical protein